MNIVDPTVFAVVGVLMRWVHIASAVTLIGGAIYVLYVVLPAVAGMESRGAVLAGLGARFRPLILGAVIGLLVSGAWSFFMKPAMPPRYLMWFSLKMLLVLHILTVAFRIPRASAGEAPRLKRMMTGLVASGLVVILVSAYLRLLSNWTRI